MASFSPLSRSSSLRRISRARTLVAAGVAAASMLSLTACRETEPPPRRPDVVMIVIDTLRADALGAYGAPGGTRAGANGQEASPAIDALAADSVRYERAYSQAPWTTPSVAALLTSLFPTEIGIVAEPNRVDDRFELLSERLAAEGYDTGAVISHYFISRQWNFHQGFRLFDESNAKGHAAVTSRDVTDRALAMVDEMTGKPFFLFVHYFDVHYDYLEHEAYPRTDPGYGGPVRSGMEFAELEEMAPGLAPEDVRHVRNLYTSEVAFTDHHVGRLIEGLKERDRYEPSLVIFTADHGEELRERGTIGHGGTLFDEQIRVPLLIKRPGGAEAGTVVAEPVGLVDVFPTVLELLGLPVPEGLGGRSLARPAASSALSLASPRPRPVFSEASWAQLRSVVDGRWKVIHHTPSEFRYHFFDLPEDPGEMSNLAARQAELGLAEEFRAANRKLKAWTAYVEARASNAGEVDLDPELRRELEALGYLQ